MKLFSLISPIWAANYSKCPELEKPTGVESISCDKSYCSIECEAGSIPLGRKRVRCEAKGTTFKWNGQLSPCSTCRELKTADPESNLRCRISKSSKLPICNSQCKNKSSHYIDGMFKKLIYECRCRKEKDENGKMRRQCKWRNGHKNISPGEIENMKCETACIDYQTPNGQNFKKSKKSKFSDRQPHILFILADDYGYHDIGYHGASVLTPNMDQLAGDGIKLESYYVQASCSPTRSQLMTGRYQIRNGLQKGVIRPTQRRGIPLTETILPQHLKSCGYSTDIYGKWHLGMFKEEYYPQNRGFDYFNGFLTGGQDFWTHQKCHGQKTGGKTKKFCGFDYREAHAGQDEVILRNITGTYTNDIMVDAIKKRLKNADPTVPNFTYFALQAVHGPIQAPERYIDIYRNIINHKRRDISAMITAMDDAIGDVVQAYKDAGLWENTIVIFSSDNGGKPKDGGSNFPLRGGKGNHFEGGVRSVGWIHSPLMPESKRGTTANNLMHVTDWMPTLMDISQCQPAPGQVKPLDGISQTESLFGESSGGKYDVRNEILHTMDPLTVTLDTDKRGDWKGNDGILKDRCFNIQIKAVLRVGPWKLMTGKDIRDFKHAEWSHPKDQLYPGASSIFDKIDLPMEAFAKSKFVQDDEIPDGDYAYCDETCLRIAKEGLESSCKNLCSPKEMNKPWSQAKMVTTKNCTEMLENAVVADLAAQVGLTGSQTPPEDRLVQLYNVDDDPYEASEISDDFPNVVNALLYKLANYYDEQVDPYYPPEDDLAHPDLHGGVWKAWVK